MPAIAWTPYLSNTQDMMEGGCEICTPPTWSELAFPNNNSNLDYTGLKVDNFRNLWAYIFLAVFGLILKWKSHAIA